MKTRREAGCLVGSSERLGYVQLEARSTPQLQSLAIIRLSDERERETGRESFAENFVNLAPPPLFNLSAPD